jgi:hypothetical protein
MLTLSTKNKHEKSIDEWVENEKKKMHFSPKMFKNR